MILPPHSTKAPSPYYRCRGFSPPPANSPWSCGLTTVLLRQPNFAVCVGCYVTYRQAEDDDVLTVETYNLENPSDTKEAFKVVFFPTGGILAADWEEWKTQRRMTAPSLSEAVIGELTPKFDEASRPFFQILERAAKEKEVVEMDEVFVALTMDTIGLILLGRTFCLLDGIVQGNTEPVPFLQALTRMGTEATRQSALPRWVLKYKLWRPSRKVREAKQVINDFLDSCIDQRLQENRRLGPGEVSEVNLLNILLDAEANGGLTRDSIKGQLLSFIFAGYDTTAHTLCFMLYEASKNPDIRRQLEAEALAAMPNRDGAPLELKAINQNMTFLEKVWMETLRLHPVVGDGLEIPPGKTISISPYVIQQDERYWPNPAVFDPSSFEPEAVTQRASCSLVTFSAGPRNCLGSRLARAEALTVMTTLFRRFQVTCVETEQIEEQTLFTTRPKNGIRFTFEARE